MTTTTPGETAQSEIEQHWHECRHCRETGPCEQGVQLAQYFKTYGDQRDWEWACKILAGPN